MKKSKIVILIVIILAIVITTIICVVNKNAEKETYLLFKSGYSNYAWDKVNYGYYIYSDGEIKEFDEYETNKKKEDLKSAKITKDELKKLKQLADSVEDKYEPNPDAEQIMDAGSSAIEIYSQKYSKWVLLSVDKGYEGSNKTEESQQILKLTEELEDKYIKD